MIIDLTSADTTMIEEARAQLRADPASAQFVTFQCLSDQLVHVPGPVLSQLNDVFAEFPDQGLRLYAAMKREPVNLDPVRALPNLRHLQLHYSVPALESIAPLAALNKLETAELEIYGTYPLPDILTHWPNLTKLRLIREGKASKAVDLSAIATLPKLRDLSVMGYAKGIAALANCRNLRRLRLQSLRLPQWNVLPSHGMDHLTLNAVTGPDPVPFARLQNLASNVALIRMTKNLPFAKDKAFSPIDRGGWFSVQIDYLNDFFEDAQSGHDWAELIGSRCPPPDGVTCDPEAGALRIDGPKRALVPYQDALALTFAALITANG